MVQVSFPGVYVQEVSSGVRTITGVSTSIAAFVGMVERGLLNTPVHVLSFADYQRAFGDNTTVSEMTDQVRQFFLNGGQEAFIVRIADASTVKTATVGLDSETKVAVLTLTAKDAGMAGNQVRAEVNYNTPNPESTFNLRLFREVVRNGVLQVDADETLSGLSMDPNDPNYVETVVNQRSTLATATVTAPPASLKGFSRSGLLIDMSDADAATSALNGLIAAPNNKISVRVDGGAPIPVILSPLPPTGTMAQRLAKWADDINGLFSTLVVEVVSVAGPDAFSYFQIRSLATGGSVVVEPGTGGDATQALQLGVGQGGIEIGGHADRRPAPTGLFSIIGFDLARLNSFAAASGPDITFWTLSDASGDTPPHTATITFPAGKFYAGTFTPTTSAVFKGSLRNVRQRLDTLAASINQNTNGRWTAAFQGMRLVLTPTFGTVNSDTSALLTSNKTGGSGFDIGGTNQLFSQTSNVRAYSFGPSGAGSFQVPGQTGSDGTQSPQKSDYENAFAIMDREIDVFNLLILPKTTQQGFVDNRGSIWGTASALCLARRAFLIADAPTNLPDGWNDVATVVAQIDNFRIGLVKDHTALYWPPLEIANGNGTTRTIDPSGSIAGIMARIDSNRGVFKAPAGIEADVRGIRGVEVRMSDPENGLLNPKAVNAIRVFPNGIVSWGARTLDGFDNSGNSDYKFVPVRRLALFIEESLVRGLKFAVFEPNDEPLWAQIRLAAGAFMNNLFRQGAFQGRKQSDAFFVKVDSETTTQNDINLGIVNVVVGFAPLRPAEFIVITIQQKAGQVQV